MEGNALYSEIYNVISTVGCNLEEIGLAAYLRILT
jgi:hypothetical protein